MQPIRIQYFPHTHTHTHHILARYRTIYAAVKKKSTWYLETNLRDPLWFFALSICNHDTPRINKSAYHGPHSNAPNLGLHVFRNLFPHRASIVASGKMTGSSSHIGFSPGPSLDDSRPSLLSSCSAAAARGWSVLGLHMTAVLSATRYLHWIGGVPKYIRQPHARRFPREGLHHSK